MTTTPTLPCFRSRLNKDGQAHYIDQASIETTHPLIKKENYAAYDAGLIMVSERHAKSDLAEMTGHLLATIAALKPTWHPINTAPKDGTPLLLFARAKDATASIDMIGWYLPERGWIAQSLWGQTCIDITPSHWMHTPPFPESRL